MSRPFVFYKKYYKCAGKLRKKLLTNPLKYVIILKRKIHIEFAPVAQLVEHLTFNQGVWSSILHRSTTGTDLLSPLFILSFRDVAQLVARVLWEHDVAGSNPVIPTINHGDPRREGLFLLIQT